MPAAAESGRTLGRPGESFMKLSSQRIETRKRVETALIRGFLFAVGSKEHSFHGSMKAALCGTLSSGGRRRRVKCSTISTASAQTRTVGGGLSSKPSSSSALAYLTIGVGMDRHGRNRALCAEILQRTPSNPLLVLHVPTEERSIKRRRRRRTFTAIALPPLPSKKSAMRSYDE